MKKTLQQTFKLWRKFSHKKLLLMVVLAITLVIIGLSSSVLILAFSYKDRIYPGIEVAGLPVGNLTLSSARSSLKPVVSDYIEVSRLRIKDLESQEASESSLLQTSVEWKELDLDYDLEETLQQAYQIGRTDTWLQNLATIISLLSEPQTVEMQAVFDSQKLDSFLTDISEVVEQPGAKPELVLNEANNTFEVFPGEDGLVLDKQALLEEIDQQLSNLEPTLVELPLVYQDNRITDEQVALAKSRGLELLQQSLVVELKTKDSQLQQSWVVDGIELIKFIDFNGGFDTEQITDYIVSIAEGINKDPQNATFEFQNGKVTTFIPATNGISVETSSNLALFLNALEQLEKSEEIPPLELIATEVAPKIGTGDVNDLGIRELLGKGSSTFRGSIPGRIHNVALTASRLHGVLVPPGKTFSFNETIGEISRATGYQSAYIISGGRTILGDGGGVCQDSTTLFRAILDAGLPITQWKAHSYRVGYYEQNEKPGFDATVYSPSVDLKFENNTPGHILIQAYANTNNLSLVIELYGTDDGRVAEISNYRQWDAVPAPPPLYQDDPTLEPGQVKQVDWAAPGLKTKFDYVVTKGDETLFEKTFYSNFKPWQAVYLRGV